MPAALPDRWRLSLLQVMKLVVYGAVAAACAAPMLRLWGAGFVEGGTRRGLVLVALFEAIVVPLAWACLSFVLLPRGPSRDRWIAAMLLGSVAMAAAISLWLLVAYTVPAYRNLSGPPEKRVDLTSLVIHLLAILALTAATAFLALRLRRRLTPTTTADP